MHRPGPVHGVQSLDDDTVHTVGTDSRVALHDAKGTLQGTWRISLAEEAQRRAVFSITVSQEPPVLYVLTRDKVAISYDRRGKEVRLHPQAEAARTARLLQAPRR